MKIFKIYKDDLTPDCQRRLQKYFYTEGDVLASTVLATLEYNDSDEYSPFDYDVEDVTHKDESEEVKDEDSQEEKEPVNIDRNTIIKTLDVRMQCMVRDCDADCDRCNLLQESEFLVNVYKATIQELKYLTNLEGRYKALTKQADDLYAELNTQSKKTNQEFTKPELKPCPFCGRKEVALEYYEAVDDDEPYWQICCDHCGAMTGKRRVEYDTIDKAFEGYANAIAKVVNDWNSRKG